MSRAAYDQIEAVNWSRLNQMRKSAKHFKYALETDPEESDPMRIGRAVHLAVLEPERFTDSIAVWSSDRGRRYGKEWDAFERQAEAQDKTILTQEQFDRALAMRDSVRAHDLVKPYLLDGKPEHSLTWMDHRGFRMKARIDWVTTGVILDLKTSLHAIEPRQFAASAYRFGHFHQLAFYQRGMQAVYGQTPAALIVAVETHAPHDVAVYRLSPEAIASASEEIEDLLDELQRATDSGRWRGRFDTERTLQLPAWAAASPEDYDVTDPDWMKD
jgi:hypothetical protein